MEDRLVRSYKLAAKMLINSLKYRVFAFDLIARCIQTFGK
jgi:hypothetical protein